MFCRQRYLSGGLFWRRVELRDQVLCGTQHQYREPARVKRARAASGGGNSAGGGNGGSAAELELAAPLDAAAAGPADGNLAEAGKRRARFR